MVELRFTTQPCFVSKQIVAVNVETCVKSVAEVEGPSSSDRWQSAT